MVRRIWSKLIGIVFILFSTILFFASCSGTASVGKTNDATLVTEDDIDGDGISNDEDDDIDGDGVLNEEDDDGDGDGVIDEDDLCLTQFGDPDADGDGCTDEEEGDGDGIDDDDNEDTDSDGDGISDDDDDCDDQVPVVDEDNNGCEDPVPTDTDGDGLTDDEEAALGTDSTKSDTDGDGLTDFDEIYSYATDPNDADSDDEGGNDKEDLDAGLNPNDNENPKDLAACKSDEESSDWLGGTASRLSWNGAIDRQYYVLAVYVESGYFIDYYFYYLINIESGEWSYETWDSSVTTSESEAFVWEMTNNTYYKCSYSDSDASKTGTIECYFDDLIFDSSFTTDIKLFLSGTSSIGDFETEAAELDIDSASSLAACE